MIKVQELKVKAETSNLEGFYLTMYKCSERLLKRIQLFFSLRDKSWNKVLLEREMAMIPPNN